jgi:hypothetical protein
VPKLLRARPPVDDREEKTIRRLAASRHAPADWIQRAQLVARSWDGDRTARPPEADRRPGRSSRNRAPVAPALSASGGPKVSMASPTGLGVADTLA